MLSEAGGNNVLRSWPVPMITVPPPDRSPPPHPASNAAAPSITHAPRLTEWNRIGLRRDTANIIRLNAPRPLRARESSAMRRGKSCGFIGVEPRRLALRLRERGAERVAHLIVRRGASEARPQRRRRQRRRRRQIG